MEEDFFKEEQRLEIEKIEKYKTRALSFWGGGATFAALSLAFSKFAHENDGNKTLSIVLLLLCCYSQAGALVSGFFTLFNLIEMRRHKKKCKWIEEAEKNYYHEEIKQK